MKLLFCLLVSLWSFLLYGQYPYPKQDLAQLVKSRKLAVQLLPEESEVESAMNLVLKEAFDENWEFGEVVYLPLAAFNKLKKSSAEDYAFLAQRERLNEDLRYEMEYMDGSLAGRVKGTSNSKDDLAAYEFSSYEFKEVQLDYYDFILYIYEEKREKFVTTVSFVNSELAKHDYLFLCQQLKLLISYSADGYPASQYQETEVNLEYLSELQTHFLINYLKDEEVSHFYKYYDYGFKIINYVDYVNVILSKKPGTAYIKILFAMQQNKYMWGIVDSETGRVLSLNGLGDYKFSGTFDADKLVNPMHIRASTEINIQQVNNYYRK